MKIYKYPVHAMTSQAVGMPKGARLLSAASQGNEAFVWALVDPTAPKVGRRLTVLRTGEEFPFEEAAREVGQEAVYVGRIDFPSGLIGPMVFHVFDFGEEA